MTSKQVNLNIPVAHFQNVLSWDNATIERLVRAAVELAQKVGLRLDDDTEGIYLKEAESKGAKIDWNANAVMFSEADIEKTIDVMRTTLPAPIPLRKLNISHGRKERFSVGNGANLLFDWKTWQVKPPSAADLVDVCRWAQGCDDVDALYAPVMLKDMDLNLEPLYSYALMSKYCRKRVYFNQPTEPIHVKHLGKMSRVVEKHHGFFQTMPEWEYLNPPFRLGLRSIRTMLARVDLGACDMMGIGSMAISGMSAPVTVAGLAVCALGEILAGLTFFRILRPGFGLRANVCSGSFDLRTANVTYFGLRTHLQNIALWELLVRGIGADAPCMTYYRDANEPGMQAAYEYGMAKAFFSSVIDYTYEEIGGLACGNIFSPEQAVLDMAIIKELNELTCGFEVSKEALGLEEIVNARFEQGVHMSTEHTMRHMKDSVPFSDFLFRGLPSGSQHDKSSTQTDKLMQKAADAVNSDRCKGREIAPDTELSGEMYEYVKEAAAELGISAPPLL